MEQEKALGYIPFNGNTRGTAISKYNAHEKFDGIHRATASTSDSITTRRGFYPPDYYSQRPQDSLPVKFNDVVAMCRSVYLRVGIVRNVMDLLTDLACEDFKLIHPDKSVEAFFKVWMNKAKLYDAIDEFVRHFLIDCNVVVRRYTAKISDPVYNQWVKRTMAAQEVTPEPEKLYTEKLTNKREIPWRYTFLNVAALYWRGGDLARLTGKRQLAFKPSTELVNAVRSPSEPFQKSLVDRIPGLVKNALVNAEGLIDLDMNTLYVAHAKKDSWEDWAPPSLYSILADIHFKDKLRQAEISALDGVINVIRLWKLGDHTQGFLPGEAPIDKLIGILESNTGGGAIDIVWDSMIDMKDFYPPIDKILGQEKYNQVNRDILVGLGVPEVLIGGQGANFSNSWIQLKTVVERLKFIRRKVIEWIEGEVNIVCEAMDIETAPIIRFPQNNLEDENISRKLIVGLLDRGVISVEAVLDAYGENFLLEIERMREQKKFKLDVKSPFDPKPAPSGQSGQGRPSQTQDIGRKTRTANPRRSAGSQLIVKGLDIIEEIDKTVVPQYLQTIGVSNARKLTNENRQDVDLLRVIILSCIKPEDGLNKVSQVAAEADTQADYKLVAQINQEIDIFAAENKEKPTLEQKKRIEAIVWANYHLER